MTTETTFPFAPPEAREHAAGESSKKDNRTLLLALGGVGALVVLGLAAWFLFLSGGSENPADTVAQPTPDAQAAAPSAPGGQPAAAPAAKPVAKPVVASPGRNPFKTLLPPAPAAPAAGVAAGSGAGTPTGTTGGVTAGGTTAGGTGTIAGIPATGGFAPGFGTGTGGGTSTGTKPPVAAPVKVRLDWVASNNAAARVTIGAQTYVVRVGDTFAEKFTATRFEGGSCGTFQYGEKKFDLCERGTTSVR